MMNRRLLIVNVLLAAALVWGSLRIRESWRVFGESHDAEQILPDSPGVTPQPVAAMPAVLPVQAEWSEAAARNPFSFDRNDVSVVVEAPASQTPPAPVPILYGTLSLGGPPLAILGDGSRRSPGTKVGESFGGWKVVEINDKGVVVALNGRQETLIKGTAPRDREVVRTAPAPDRTATNSVAQPVASPATAGNAYNMNLNPSVPSVPPKGTVIEYTPFGNRLVQTP